MQGGQVIFARSRKLEECAAEGSKAGQHEPVQIVEEPGCECRRCVDCLAQRTQQWLLEARHPERMTGTASS